MSHNNPLFEQLITIPYVNANEKVVVMLPKAQPTSPVIPESHVFKQTAFQTSMLANSRGQSVELKGERVLTGLGFPQQRVCQVLGWENVFVDTRTVRVCLIDKPLYGEFVQETEKKRATIFNGGGPCEWLAVAPLVETGFFDRLQFTRKSFLLVEGYEKETAIRIRQIADSTGAALLDVEPAFKREAETVLTDIERAAYASLHSWLFPHLVSLPINQEKERNLRMKISDLPGAESLMVVYQAPKEMQSKKLVSLIVSRCESEIAKLDEIVSPHQKLSTLSRLSIAMGSVLTEMSGEHLVAGFVVLIKDAKMLNWYYPHISHMEMLLAAHPNTLALGQAAYALSAFQSALDFILNVTYTPGSLNKARRMISSSH